MGSVVQTAYFFAEYELSRQHPGQVTQNCLSL